MEEYVWSLSKHENPHFENEYNTHIIFKSNEKSGSGLDLNLLTIL
jgi:hypothetical protein